MFDRFLLALLALALCVLAAMAIMAGVEVADGARRTTAVDAATAWAYGHRMSVVNADCRRSNDEFVCLVAVPSPGSTRYLRCLRDCTEILPQ